MFDWVLNTLLNTITIFFSGVSKLKLMAFSIFFSTINFRYQYLTEAKAYLELWSFFGKYIYIFAKFTRKHLYWSLILIKLQVSNLRFHWRKGLQHRCFLVNFVTSLSQFFYGTPPGDYFCSREKIFYQQNSKEPSKKREKNRNSL